ncbi:MAG TPA: ferric reductase-like transmembrane domain-containing protein [Terriglobales bacterium]|nr:ferric reductase-like transmembrane domain-containing protein [Terriglobales bacterium]
MNATDLSADVGLVAVGVVTANLLVGSLMAMRYSPWRCWPHRKFDIFRLHRWMGYAALAVVILHPIPLLFSTTRFRLVDIVYPVHSPSQPLENSIGAIALYCVVVVVITSYFRLWLGRRLWKAFHFVIYAAAFALFWHSIFTDPTLKHAPLDPFDGEKVFIEACCVLIVALGSLRWRYAIRKTLPRTVQIRDQARLL